MESIRHFIERRLRLKINATKSAVAKPEERHFLGFRLKRDLMEGEVSVHLSKRSKTRIDGKIRDKTPRNWGKSLNQCIGKLNEYLTGWMGFFRACTKEELTTFGTLDAHIRRRLRAIILKQCKRKRFIVRRLIRLGVKPKTAWNRVYQGRQSLWALSHNSAVDRGLRNAYFAERGLVSLVDKWNRFNPETIVVVPVQLSMDFG
jgi:hypothetical protein